MKLKYPLIVLFVFTNTLLFAQESFPPNVISQGIFIKKTIPLRDFPTAGYIESENENGKLKIIQNRLRANRKVNENALPLAGDPIAQHILGGVHTLPPNLNFDGATQNEGQALPPDPTGAVGPNHYVHAVNLVVKIFDKSGNLLAGPTFLGDFLGSGNNSGDPIVLYDQMADRFFVSQFGAASNSLVVGVSETSDPTGSYFVYEFPLDAFPDYPHYSVWPDGYYFTANKFAGNTTYAIEREVILAGGPNPKIVGFTLPGVINNPNTVFSPEPANLVGTQFPTDVPGYIVYLQDDGWAGVSFDHLKIWEIVLDWTNVNNSTISAPLEVPTTPFEATFAPFGSGDIQQPGTNQKIDIIGGVISYAANYRSFGGYNSWLITFTVDVNGSDLAGIRWIELRNDAVNGWSIFQEGTYAPADNLNRFMASAAMDAAGNIGMAFNIGSATVKAGIRYTGRFNDDPLGEMTVAETTIIDGNGVQTNTNRFGDYSHLTIDPDNFTFWHTAEYFSSNNSWRSRIASFNLSGGFLDDAGISNITEPNNGILTNTETVTVTIRNYGTATQTNIPLELRLDGNLVANEVFIGSIATNETADYTFSQTVDLSTPGQTYILEANTLLAGDEFAGNDNYIKEVTHLLANDIGVIAITEPQTGSGLGNETVTVTVKNFGAEAQSGFDVQYSIDGGTPVVETFTGNLESEAQMNFSFAQQGDFSNLGTYTITSRTNLAGDQDPSNDDFEKTVENLQCLPQADCSFGDGFERFAIGTIDNNTGCSPNGYGDYTNLNTELTLNNTITVTVKTGFSDQIFSVWIDYNDNSVFEEEELVIIDVAVPTENQNLSTTFDIPNDAGLLGTHLLRARMGWSISEDTSADPCIDFTYGETEDYTVTIVNEVLGIGENDFNHGILLIYPISERNYEINFNSTANFDNLSYKIYNTIGQKITEGNMVPDERGYKAVVNLSNIARGMYLVNVRNGKFTTVQRIIIN